MLWQDDFSSLALNRWKIIDHHDQWSQIRNVYLKENVSVNSGNLVIEVKKEDYSCPPWAISQWWCNNQYYTGNIYNYTSGHLETKSPYYVRYGFLEERIKTPYGKALTSAFWTYRGDNIPITNEGEIDIFEPIGSEPSDRFGTNVHLSYPPSPINFPQDIGPGSSFDYSTQWHKYAVEWSPSKIIWYLDDIPIRILDNPGVVDFATIKFNLAVRNDVSTNFPPTFFLRKC